MNIKQIRAALMAKDPNCFYCGRVLQIRHATIDHVIPRSAGGTNKPSNIRVCCAICNIRKGSHPLEYVAAQIHRGYGLQSIDVKYRRLLEKRRQRTAG